MNEFSRVPFYGREVGGVCALSAKIGACLQLVGEEEKSVDNLSFAHVFEGEEEKCFARIFRGRNSRGTFGGHIKLGLASHILPYIVSDKAENGGVGKWRS